ncbi:MAG: response regulator transcription factor [Candidatus Korobacteraceae bacterium]
MPLFALANFRKNHSERATLVGACRGNFYSVTAVNSQFMLVVRCGSAFPHFCSFFSGLPETTPPFSQVCLRLCHEALLTRKTPIMIVDDFEPWRRLVKTILHDRSDLEIVCEAADGSVAVAKSAEFKPELILLDLSLPLLNGIEVAKQVLRDRPECKIIVMSEESSPDIMRAVLATGVMGYVRKLTLGIDLAKAIDAVQRGEKFISKGVGNKNTGGGPQIVLRSIRDE